MRMYDIIAKKRDGKELSDAEIRFVVNGYVAEQIPDYQVSALLMAIYFNGMTEQETASLTQYMAMSGDIVDLTYFGDFSSDKHSTGGVGDKTTLIVAPIAAACGCKVAKMSGRGLGHTGGTADKLEAIKGYKTNISGDEFFNIVNKVGVAVVTQSGNLTPADKKLYALRDVTATVESIPLITSSVMSKKLASGAKNIVLDVKYGSGAFMKTKEDAEKLAQSMVNIGKLCGRKTTALITDMNTPLGFAVGNSLEVIEAIDVLKGKQKGDLYEISIALAGNMIALANNISEQEAQDKARRALDSGMAFLKFREWIVAQGGDANCIDDTSRFDTAAYSMEIKSSSGGFISCMDCEKIGAAAAILGAGRITKEDKIDLTAGIILSAKTGDYVGFGDRIATLYSNSKEKLSEAAAIYKSAIQTGSAPQRSPLIYKTIK
ncbi:MAG: thymidine phosphorylase [Clostridia bacterium]|nr:thymidine phosphorylase [Clostridia bacterium]